MSESLNNQLDFYHNQIPQNPSNQANVLMKTDKREVSFVVDSNFLQSSLSHFLEDNFKKIQNIEQNNQKIDQIYNVFQIMGQEINNLKNDLTKAFQAQNNKINKIDEEKNIVNKNCYEFFNKWQVEDSKNKESINKVYKELNESNSKIANEINCRSKKLEESILQNNSENNDFKSKFEILKKDINLAQRIRN